MSRISEQQVAHVAELARLSLSEEETHDLASELDALLEYVELLRELDTSEVPPTSHAIPLPTPMRDDRPETPIDPDLALANAPARRDDAFVVPRVIDAEDEG